MHFVFLSITFEYFLFLLFYPKHYYESRLAQGLPNEFLIPNDFLIPPPPLAAAPMLPPRFCRRHHRRHLRFHPHRRRCHRCRFRHAAAVVLPSWPLPTRFRHHRHCRAIAAAALSPPPRYCRHPADTLPPSPCCRCQRRAAAAIATATALTPPPRFRLRCRCRRRPPPPYCHHCHPTTATGPRIGSRPLPAHG